MELQTWFRVKLPTRRNTNLFEQEAFHFRSLFLPYITPLAPILSSLPPHRLVRQFLNHQVWRSGVRTSKGISSYLNWRLDRLAWLWGSGRLWLWTLLRMLFYACWGAPLLKTCCLWFPSGWHLEVSFSFQFENYFVLNGGKDICFIKCTLAFYRNYHRVFPYFVNVLICFNTCPKAKLPLRN